MHTEHVFLSDVLIANSLSRVQVNQPVFLFVCLFVFYIFYQVSAKIAQQTTMILSSKQSVRSPKFMNFTFSFNRTFA